MQRPDYYQTFKFHTREAFTGLADMAEAEKSQFLNKVIRPIIMLLKKL